MIQKVFVKEVLSDFKMTRGIINPAKPNPNAVETRTLKMMLKNIWLILILMQLVP